jgi:hypothetical protein
VNHQEHREIHDDALHQQRKLKALREPGKRENRKLLLEKCLNLQSQ